MLNSLHHANTFMSLDIVVVAIAFVRVVSLIVSTADVTVGHVLKLKVALIRMLRSVVVLVVVLVMSLVLVSPVIWTVLDAMGVMVLIDVLGVMLTVITVRVVVAKVVITLRLNIVVFTMLLTSEMTLVTNMRHVVLQVPVSLLEVSIGVVLVSVDKLSHVRLLKLMSVLVGGLLVARAILSGEVGSVVLALLGWLSLLLGLLLLRRLLLLLLVVHLFVEESGLGAHMLLSLGLGSWGLWVMIWIMMVRVRVVVVGWRLVRVLAVVDLMVRLGVLTVHIWFHSVSSVWLHVLLAGGVWVLGVVWSIGISTVGWVAVRIVLTLVDWLRVVHLTLHVTVALLGSDVVVSIGLLCLLALLNGVLWRRLSSDWLRMDGLECVRSVAGLLVIRLHLEDQFRILDVSVGGAEGSAVSIESSIVGFVPPVGVEGVELVSPVEVERLGLVVVGISLNIVVHDIPRHILSIESLAPRVESGRPEVHHDGLWLCGQLHGGVILSDAAHLLVINGVSDEVGGPFHLVDVPVILRVEAGLVVVALTLGVAVAIDHVHAEWVLLDRWHDLHIKLVPPAWVEVGTIPVGEEGADCALLSGGLHAGDEFTIGELLEASDGSRFEHVSFSDSKG